LWEASRSTPAAPVITPALRSSFTSNLNRIPSSRRLERECQRNIEMIWLTGRLAPDFKTIADFRKDNGRAIREVCREFVALCHKLDLFSAASVAMDQSSKLSMHATRTSPKPR
jgi:Transposase domain (DUF772)